MHQVTNVEHDIQKLFIIIFIILWSQVYDFRFVISTEKRKLQNGNVVFLMGIHLLDVFFAFTRDVQKIKMWHGAILSWGFAV